MPVWLIIQLLLLVICIIVGIYLYQSKLWKGGFPFEQTQILKSIFFYFVPVSWSILSIVSGVLILAINSVHNKVTAFFYLQIIMPAAVLILYSAYTVIKIIKVKSLEMIMKTSVQKKVHQCKEWVEQFPFINNEMIEVKIYISRGQPVGRLIVHNVSKKQASELETSKDTLPDGIYLELLDLDENKWLH